MDTKTVEVDGFTFTVPERTTRTIWHVQFSERINAFYVMGNVLVFDEKDNEGVTISEGLLRVKWHNATVTLVPLQYVVAITSYELKHEKVLEAPAGTMRLPRR